MLNNYPIGNYIKPLLHVLILRIDKKPFNVIGLENIKVTVVL